jgi:Meiotically up-regulated gene 113
MSRRIDPMERVRELGGASVPFGFDVHALFFSDDAVGVEAELHRRFAGQRVNRLNTRREYFYATPAAVKIELAEVTGNLLEFNELADAEQYRASERMRAGERENLPSGADQLEA